NHNLMVNHDLKVAGNLEVDGKIFTNEITSEYFYIRCHDLLIGGTGLPNRSPNVRRALVDFSDRLVVNFGSDWPVCMVNQLANGSSARMKEGIVDMTMSQAEDVLRRLRPRSFRFKNDAAGGTRHGFVAEEAPEVVATGEKTGIFLDGI